MKLVVCSFEMKTSFLNKIYISEFKWQIYFVFLFIYSHINQGLTITKNKIDFFYYENCKEINELLFSFNFFPTKKRRKLVDWISWLEQMLLYFYRVLGFYLLKKSFISGRGNFRYKTENIFENMQRECKYCFYEHKVHKIL